MKTFTPPAYTHGLRQRGAVVIMFGLLIFVLFGFMALAIDLGRTYVVRTELQNAADAAALAGAKQLNQTAAGVCCGSDSAVSRAIAIAAQNSFKFSTPVTITSADISVGSCPDDACMVPASSVTIDAIAAGKSFLKIYIPSGLLATFFAVVPTTDAGTGTPNTSTYGRAVAGRFINNVSPLGVCAIKNAAGKSRPKGEALPITNELAQFGFRRGVSYNIFDVNPLGGSSNPYLLNPIDVPPNCNPSSASVPNTAPFVCSGSSAILTITPGIVYGNTGMDAGQIEAALNSRFNDYRSPSVCIPAVAPPDINIRNYACTGSTCASPAADWMAPSPTVQTISSPGMPMPPSTIASADKYGVLWSYSRAVRAVGVSPNATPGAAFNPSDWATLYPAPGGSPATYANFLAATSPYLDPGHSTAPVGNPGLLDRRVVNLAIADCPNISGSGSCQEIPVLGIGRFFMQVPADFSGGSKNLQMEFAGLIEPVPTADIKLYR